MYNLAEIKKSMEDNQVGTNQTRYVINSLKSQKIEKLLERHWQPIVDNRREVVQSYLSDYYSLTQVKFLMDVNISPELFTQIEEIKNFK